MLGGVDLMGIRADGRGLCYLTLVVAEMVMLIPGEEVAELERHQQHRRLPSTTIYHIHY